jgi:hypothetical protein
MISSRKKVMGNASVIKEKNTCVTDSTRCINKAISSSGKKMSTISAKKFLTVMTDKSSVPN